MLILILIDVQYSQKVVFSFEKGLNCQNLSSSGFLHPVKKSPLPVKFPIPPQWGNPPTPYHYLEKPAMNIDEVLLINSSAIAFVFGCFNIHQKDWLTYSGGTDRPGKLCCYHRRPNSLQIFNFPTWIPNCDLHSHALLDLFISSVASFCSTMALPPIGNSDHVVVSVSIDFPSNFPSRFLEAAKPI